MRLSIPAKVFSGFAAVLATFGMVTSFGVLQMHRIGDGLELVSAAYHPLTRIGAQLEASYRNSEEATNRLLVESDPKTRRALLYHALDYQPRAARDKVRAAQGIVQKARQLGPAGEETPFLDRIEGLLQAVLLRYDEYARAGAEVNRLIDKLEQAPPDEARLIQAKLDPAVRKLKQVEVGIGNGVQDFTSELDNRIDMRVAQTGAEERRSTNLILVLSLAAVVVALFVIGISQRTLAPIRWLTEAVKEVGEGQFAREIEVRADDELGLLAAEFNAMQGKLRERDRQLQEKTAELLRSERLAAVGRLAAQITHEIRNPLSSISLNVELLQEQIEQGALDEPEARDEARSLMRAMAREVDRLTEITEGYLRFARLPKPSLAPVDLNDAVEELADFMAPELAQSQVKLERRLAQELPRVNADPGQLRQVLLNLLRNAREATGKGGHVQLATRIDTERKLAFVEVGDDGPGIPDDVRQRIFEPFFSTKERGTGLGLALVQQVVHEHGGDVSCDSAPGKGTRFVFSLPLSDGAAIEPPALEAITPLPPVRSVIG